MCAFLLVFNESTSFELSMKLTGWLVYPMSCVMLDQDDGSIQEQKRERASARPPSRRFFSSRATCRPAAPYFEGEARFGWFQRCRLPSGFTRSCTNLGCIGDWQRIEIYHGEMHIYIYVYTYLLSTVSTVNFPHNMSKKQYFGSMAIFKFLAVCAYMIYIYINIHIFII